MQDALLAPEDIRDAWEKSVPGLGLGRDPVRTPIHGQTKRMADSVQGNASGDQSPPADY
jgi:hypothetical protein